LDALKLTLEENVRLLHERMDGLIRSRHISAEMTISLMKDSTYVNQIIKNLIDVNSSYLKSELSGDGEVKNLVALDDAEIDTVLSESGK